MSVSLSAEVLSRPASRFSVASPLCVDLDGTLIFSDLLFESLILLIKRKPYFLLLMPFWLLRGRAVLKAEIATRVTLNVKVLPYHDELIRWLVSERILGRRLWLCTAAHELLAAAVAGHLKLFDGVLASDRSVNLTGEAKAARLVEHFGERGFDYCGNEQRDIAIWKRARGAIVIHSDHRLPREVARHADVLHVFHYTKNTLREIARALRPHQWAKNLLIFVPLLAAHGAGEVASLVWALLATVAFCLCASSVYIVNDLLDLEADRVHARKSKRPFAAGRLSLLTGILLAPMLLGAALFISLLLPGKFQFVLAMYYALTVAYSFALKGLVLIDVFTLAGLYTLRIIAGAAAVNVPLSFWLLWFSMFLFLSLAFVKRYAELHALLRQQHFNAVGRDYVVDDLPILQSMGTASGYLSVVVLALYINSPEINALYAEPKVIWLLCVLVLYWISRVWVKAQRGEMHDDPVVFALKDRISQVVGLLAATTVILAI
jgi:4-hydroxybenzoate polyprenyltransferase/phosphoserine phosphatase